MGEGWFQSLIGRLQTDGGVDALGQATEFQSLIGRLQTPRGPRGGRGRAGVSIPHR